MRPGFLWGLVVGLGAMWAWHAFIRPLPGKQG
jgi:hypothetical protein